jgi:acetate kinase
MQEATQPATSTHESDGGVPVLLVVNCGSSSLKYATFSVPSLTPCCAGQIENIGQAEMRHRFWGGTRADALLPRGDHRAAFCAMVASLASECDGAAPRVAIVAHRVVHGGERYRDPVLVDDDVLTSIDELAALAPLHNPINALGIREARAAFAFVPQVAVFDTAFHQTIPAHAYLYGLPYELYEKHRLRRYGFHGSSHQYAALEATRILARPALRLISCHLGNGSSVAAIEDGRSIDTSMGLTPTEGLLMGTRTGDVDPGLLVHLLRVEKLGSDELDALLNRRGGLRGISGTTHDFRDIERSAAAGDARAALALEAFAYRLRKYIGAYAAALGGLDALVFTGGIGQGSSKARSLSTTGLGFLGIALDEQKNASANGKELADISAANAAVRTLVIPANEEWMIAREALRVIAGKL